MQSKEEREKEIVRKYDALSLEARKLVDTLNDNWVEKERLRSEYRSLAGKDISHS